MKSKYKTFALSGLNRSYKRISVPITIVRSEAKSWYVKSLSDINEMSPDKAHDGNYNTFYSVKDGDTDGNFLKLYLSATYRIGVVKITNRLDGCCAQRILNTVVKAYSGAAVAANCGTISGMHTMQNSYLNRTKR